METLLNSLHGYLGKKAEVSLILYSTESGVAYAVEIAEHHRTLFIQELQDVYPGTIVKRDEEIQPDDQVVLNANLFLNPDVLSIRTFDEFVDAADDRTFADPMAGVLASVRTGKSRRITQQIELNIRKAARYRTRNAERILQRARTRFRSEQFRTAYLRYATSHHRFLRTIARLTFLLPRKNDIQLTEPPKSQQNLFECRLTITIAAPQDATTVAKRRLAEITAAFSRFTRSETAFQSKICSGKKRARRFLLSAKEVATLWHPLTESGDAVSRVARPAFREVEPPLQLSQSTADATVLGRTKFRQEHSQFAIEKDDLRRHLLAIGKTGCGKSTFLLNVISQQVAAGRGVVLIDPHGQLAEETLSVVPRHRTNDVIYFDASEKVAPVSFNPMSGPPGTDPTLIADGLLTSFKNVFGFDEGSAPRLLHIFRNCLLSLIQSPNASLADVQRLLVDANFRRSIVAQVNNAAVREFWLTEFNRWNERDRTQYVASLQNKLGAFTTNERLQQILTASSKGIQLRTVMDQSKILVCNLSKGAVGHDASRLLGSLLLSNLQIAAMSRADVLESERPDCVVVIDEFHSYLAEGNSTMADALAESRKYRTSYVLSTQMLEQLDPETLAGVLGNCGSTLCMSVGPRDAEVLSGLLGSDLTPADLMKIPKYHAYLRLLIDGAPHTFSMTTLPPPKHDHRRADVIRRVSQQRHGQK